MMHRYGWEGKKSTSNYAFAWFIWDKKDRKSTTILKWFDWKDYK